MSERRKIRVEWRRPGDATVNGHDLELHGGEKVKLVVVKSDVSYSLSGIVKACGDAGLYEGAHVLRMPPGAEFEVWEEP